MQIIAYVELTPAQVKTIEGFGSAVVRTALSKPFVVVTFTTFQGQEVKITLEVSWSPSQSRLELTGLDCGVVL